MKTILLLFTISISTLVNSQVVREDLYIKGKEAYDANDFINASLYLFAYKEANLAYLSGHDIEKLNNIQSALEYSKSKLINVATLKPEKQVTIPGGFSVTCSLEPYSANEGFMFNGKEFGINKIEFKELEKTQVEEDQN